MARFVFRLEAVLQRRKRVERERQLVVADLERQRLDFERRIGNCQREIRSHKSDLRALLAGDRATGSHAGAGVDTRTVRLQAAASLHAQARTQRLALQLAGVYRRLEGARSELLRAATERRAVELLRERQFEAWKHEQNRREAIEIDEIATMGAGRGVGPGFDGSEATG